MTCKPLHFDIVRERRSANAESWLGLQADFDLKVTLSENGAKIEQDISPMAQAA